MKKSRFNEQQIAYILRHTWWAKTGDVTQTKKPPANPERFRAGRPCRESRVRSDLCLHAAL